MDPERTRKLFPLTTAVAALALAASTTSLLAVDFRRADSNSDEKVSIADAHYVLTYLFRGGSPPECLSAADSNDEGRLDITDSVWILNYLFRGGPAPMTPSPNPGPDPTPDELVCTTYGNGSPLADPAARLTVLDATAAGGSDGTVTIRIAVSSSASIAGYSGSIALDGPIGDVNREPTDLSGTLTNGFRNASLTSTAEGSVLGFGFLSTLVHTEFIPAGVDAAVLEITGCLREGTTAGEYPLLLEEGELVDTESGRSISPALESGILTVAADLSAGSGCDTPPGEVGACSPWPLPDPLPPVDAAFSLESGSGLRGSEVVVPFKVFASQVVQGYSCSIDFDEDVLEATALEEVFPVPDRPTGFESYFFDSSRNIPGNGIDEGVIVAAAVFNFQSACGNIPANEFTEVLRFHFVVRPEAALGSTDVVFRDGARGRGQPVNNVLTALAHPFSPATESTFVLVNSRINVLPDLTAFVRGDSNGDQKVDISDASKTLGFLFLGEERVSCFDAADANDDGNIDVSDPLATLNHLYLGGPALPPPFPGVGEDPTADDMGCLTRN